MTKSEIVRTVLALDIPSRAKTILFRICAVSTRLVAAILDFVRRHPGLELVAVAAAIAWLLSNIPLIGVLLGTAVVFLACVVGLLRELQQYLGSEDWNRR